MQTVDTNLLVRFFVDDPDDQDATSERARAQGVMRGTVFVPGSVLLELEAVLRGFYGLKRKDVLRVLTALVSSRSIVLEHRPAALQAMTLHKAGMDFGDAMHLACARGPLVTLDKKMRAAAVKAERAHDVKLV